MPRLVCAALILTLSVILAATTAAAPVREELEPGVTAVVKGGRQIFLECHLPEGDAAKELLTKYLADPEGWKVYKNRLAVAIPFDKLSQEARRTVLETLFPDDYVDGQGWWHTVKFAGAEGVETWWALAEWFTGAGANQQALRAADQNKGCPETLKAGQKVVIPAGLVSEALRTPSAKTPPEDQSVIVEAEEELTYGKDDKGPYAEYVLKKGETVYSAVAARFTDYHEDKDIVEACAVIQKRSGIKDAHKAGEGQKVRIPLEILSDRYQPQGSQERREYDAVDEEARRLQSQRVQAKDLEGVVVILDPGHGGRDQGASISKLGLYEDKLNYDVVCRVKRILETKTRAKVYVTMKDLDSGYEASDAKSFVHDENEVVLTTPPYKNQDAHFSVNLRWYLVNAIYRKEVDNKTDPRKMLFASIHCDMLRDGGMRGTMIYVPGTKYRQGNSVPSGGQYDRFEEARGHGNLKFSQADCIRDEALSRLFAATLAGSLARHKPPVKVHSSGNSIRNVIRQGGGRTFVPAVLRNSLVPTKVLVEIANLTNPTDQQRLADPQWRQAFAEAFVLAVKRYFGP